MKEYIKPFVEVIELPKDDIIVTSGGNPSGTGSDLEPNPRSILGVSPRSGMRFE